MTLIGVAIIVAFIFKNKLKESSFTTTPLNEKSTTALSTHKTQSLTSLERAARNLNSAQTTEQLVEELAALLKEDENLAIIAFANLESSLLENSYSFTELFKKHFSSRYTALEALDRISLWREKKPVFFKIAGVDLLTYHSSKDSPESLVSFLNDASNLEISHLVQEAVGYQIAKTDPTKGLELIEDLTDPSARELFREGLFTQWMVDDPTAVANFLNENIDTIDATYDNILEKFIGHAENDLNDVYLEWANLIQDPQIREESLLALGKRWIQDSAFQDEYRNWKNTLSSDQNKNLREQLTAYEAEFSKRQEIQNDFRTLFNEVKIASSDKGSSRHEIAVQTLNDNLRDLMGRVAREPNDFVLRQELDTIHQQLSDDYRGDPNLNSSLQATLRDIVEDRNIHFQILNN